MFVFKHLSIIVKKACPRLAGCFLLSMALLTSPPTSAATSKTKHRVYVLGSLSTGLQNGPVRLGLFDWEFGILGAGTNGYTLGLAKIFHLGSTYTGFGPLFMGYSVFGLQAPGLFACVGKEYEWLSFLFFRAEFFMSVLADGSTEGGPLLGLVVAW